MTEAHEPNDIDGPHEGPIKTPKQLILAVLYAFVVPIFGIVLLVMYVTTDNRPAAGSDAFTDASIALRIQPVGRAEVKDATDPTSMKTGEQVYAAQCSACHTTGALNAPKVGDTAAWAPRLKQGYDALVQASIKGKGQMPPQGGGDFSDFEIARAVVWLTNQAGAKFAEPVMPAAVGVAASGASAPMMAAPAASGPPADANTGRPEGMNAGAPSTAAVATAPAPATPPVTAPAAMPAITVAAAPVAPALYTQLCSACHIAGVAGSPKLGDKAAWAPRIALGLDALTASVIKGKGAMPPKGGSNASDADIRTAVTYMVNVSK